MAASALHLFDGPYVVIAGRRTEVPEGSKRLLVLVALRGGRVERRTAAGTLWPVGDDVRAAGNLRSALWRLRGAGIDLVDADKHSLHLAGDTAVDLREVSGRVARVVAGHPHADDLDLTGWGTGPLDLLPGWYDDWVVFERERLRQRLLHGMEALSRLLSRDGRHADAVDVALVAVAADPLRESAQRTLVEAHLAEGNLVEARRAFGSYRATIARELGVTPGPELCALVARPGRTPVEVPTRVRAVAQPCGCGTMRM